MTEQVEKKKRRLGKGLSSLLNQAVEVDPPKTEHVPQGTGELGEEKDVSLGTDGERLTYVSIEQIAPNPRQPRQVFDEEGLSALADSIQSAGLMQPIMIRKSAEGDMFEIVAGERRWRAAQLAGLEMLPVIVRTIDDRTSAEWALIENLQREDLNPIDKAEAFDRLIVDFDATQQDIANQLGIDRSSVANFIRLNDLESFAKDAVRDGRLTRGHAKVLLGIPDATTCKAIARRCSKEQWSVRELERQLKKRAAKGGTQPKELEPREMFLQNLGEQLTEHLGTQVAITSGKKKGTGKISISFYSNEQFEGLLDSLQFKPTS